MVYTLYSFEFTSLQYIIIQIVLLQLIISYLISKLGQILFINSEAHR